MDKEKRSLVITIEELEARARELVTPIDFDALIQAGSLEKHKGWYRILKMHELPAHAKAKIHKVITKDKETLVKFPIPQ